MRTKFNTIMLAAFTVCFIFISGSQAEVNITDKVRILPHGLDFDHRNGTSTYSFRLQNISRDVLPGSFKVVVEKLDNDHVSIKNPDGYTQDGKMYFIYDQKVL